MPGLYNNETGMYEDVEWLRDGQWFDDREGFLYIIPQKGAVADSMGPDNALEDLLNIVVEALGYVPPEMKDILGVTKIPLVLRRFNPENGYYHA